MNRRTGRSRLAARLRPIAWSAAVAVVIAGCAGVPAPGPSASDSPRSASPGSTAPPARPASPFASLSGYLSRRAGVITAAVYDARTGHTWVYHRGVLEYTASIVKVEIMGTALRQAQAKGRALPPGEARLVPPMIEASDNQAATTLLADVGGAHAVGQFDRVSGMTQTTPSKLALIPGTQLPGWGLTTTTAADQVHLVRLFAYHNSTLSDYNRAYGLNFMERVEHGQNWGVGCGVAPGTTVALKNGWLPFTSALRLASPGTWQIDSIGWVRGHGRDYVLAVLTRQNPGYAYGIDTIQAISRRIYAELGPRRAGSRGPGGTSRQARSGYCY